MPRQQRGVHVQHGVREHREQVRREDVARRGDYPDVRRERVDTLRRVAAQSFGLQHLDASLGGQRFHGRRQRLAATAARPVRLRHHEQDLDVRRIEEPAQRGDGVVG